MPAGLVFMVQAIFGLMGPQSLLHLGALFVAVLHPEYSDNYSVQ